MTAVFVVNSGSSSIKYQLIDVESEQSLLSGLVERIGDGGPADHTEAMVGVLATLDGHEVGAVGHRVVHGGSQFSEATLITPDVIAAIDSLSALAPLHNPANLLGIHAAMTALPDVAHVAVFDTAFHQTLPPSAYTYAIDAALAAEHRVRRYGFHGTSHKFVSEEAAAFLGRPLESLKTIVLHLGNGASAAAYTYAIDAELAAKHRVRRYGFHGTSHKFVSEAAAAFLDRPLGELKQIVFHLGNGASACAIDGGRSVDTSMGMTPLEGLVMGTRSGDLDPAVLFHLHRKAGLGFDELDTLLNRRSGLLGLSGTGDMRDVTESASKGDEAAQLALDVTVHRLRHYLGAYLAVLGGLDVVVFTAGVGENAPLIRAGAVQGLEGLGIILDEDRNAERARGIRVISTDDSPVTVLVVPTNEELEIARQTVAALA